MRLSHGPLALTAAMLIFPIGFMVIRAHPAEASGRAQAPAKASAPQAAPAADRPATIQGKTIDEWLAALKDPDPKLRERAVEVVGEHALDPAVPEDERSRLGSAISRLVFSDKDADIRQAAAFFADLERIASDPERVKLALEDRRRIIKPTPVPIRLVDAQGRPVAGAIASSFFWKDADYEPSFTSGDPNGAATADSRGELTLKLEVPGHLDAAAVYAMHGDGDHPLVGLRSVTLREIREKTPITVTMHPACRVRVRLECPGFRELEERFHVDLRNDWWRAAYVWLGEDHRSPRPLFTSSTRGELEFLLPPGRYMIWAYANDASGPERVIEVKPGHRVLSLGVLEATPSDEIKKGEFLRGFWRSARRDPKADPADPAAEERVTYRRPRWGPFLRGESRQANGVAYSPDGRWLASAHWYNADLGDVKLWDTRTGRLAATFAAPSGRGDVTEPAFSPDGKILAVAAGSRRQRGSPGVVMVWDVAGRRDLRMLQGHTAGIGALAFAPDGRTLASGGAEGTVRLWDVATGREVGRVGPNRGPVRSLAYAPDGKTLAIVGGNTVTLWDVRGNRPGPVLEPGEFSAHSVAYAPDGRTLAAAGQVVETGQAGVRLYDLTKSPPDRRAELMPPPRGAARGPDRPISNIAFTPDGRLVGIMMGTISIWDVATGDRRDSLTSFSDRLTVSPDGRWLAITQPAGVGLSILDISPPGP